MNIRHKYNCKYLMNVCKYENHACKYIKIVCSCILTFGSSFCYTCRMGLSNIAKEHSFLGTLYRKKTTISRDELYSVLIPCIFTSCQFWPILDQDPANKRKLSANILCYWNWKIQHSGVSTRLLAITDVFSRWTDIRICVISVFSVCCMLRLNITRLNSNVSNQYWCTIIYSVCNSHNYPPIEHIGDNYVRTAYVRILKMNLQWKL